MPLVLRTSTTDFNSIAGFDGGRDGQTVPERHCHEEGLVMPQIAQSTVGTYILQTEFKIGGNCE